MPEGVLTCKAVVDIARDVNLEVPIAHEVFEVLYNGKSPNAAVQDLMTRPQKDEVPV